MSAPMTVSLMNRSNSPFHHPLDDQTPGGVYMCQVDANVSCGACCGLYNLTDTSESNLTFLLKRRSLLFTKAARTIEGIETFATHIRNIEPSRRPFDNFHHCPFIGLIGATNQRVGCLLHPLADGNKGVDFRGLSYYGGLACSTYFCVSTYNLAPRYKYILRSVIPDWYRYGMLVTETKLLGALFSALEALFGGHLTPQHFTSDPKTAGALIKLLDLKQDWPFRASPNDTLCHHIFPDNPRPRCRIDYKKTGVAGSQYNVILIELETDIAGVDRLCQAEAMIDDRLRHTVDMLKYSNHTQRLNETEKPGG